MEQWGSSRAVSASVMEDIEPIRAEELHIPVASQRQLLSETDHKFTSVSEALIPQVPSLNCRTWLFY
jgi:hypothetical protein